MHRIRHGLVAAAATAALVTGVPSVAAAQPSPPPAPGTPTTTETTAPPGGGGTGTSPAQGLSDLLHGQGTVQTRQGQVRFALQHGTVTRLSGQTAVVTSSDGFTQNWTIGSNTKTLSMASGMQAGQIAQGESVFVIGEVHGTGANAAHNARLVVLHDTGNATQSPTQGTTPGAMQSPTPSESSPGGGY